MAVLIFQANLEEVGSHFAASLVCVDSLFESSLGKITPVFQANLEVGSLFVASLVCVGSLLDTSVGGVIPTFLD